MYWTFVICISVLISNIDESFARVQPCDSYGCKLAGSAINHQFLRKEETLIKPRDAKGKTTTQLLFIENIHKPHINKSFDPCKDIYSYVCENWKNLIPIPPHHDEWNQHLQFRYHVEDVILNNMRIEGEYPTPPGMKEKVLKMYDECIQDVCRNYNEREKVEGIKKLEKILTELGGFPLLKIKPSSNEPYRFEDGLAYAIRELNIRDVLIKFDVVKDLNNESNIIYLGFPNYGYPINLVPWNKKYMNDYENKIKKLLYPLLNYRINTKQYFISEDKFDYEIKKIIHLERRLVEDNPYHPYKKESPYKVFSENRALLHELYRDEEGKENIIRLLKKVFQNLSESFINDNTTIVYGVNQEIVIQLILSEHPDTVANYIGWRVINEFAEAAHLCEEKDRKINIPYPNYTCPIQDYDNHCKRYCSKFIFDYFDRAVELLNMMNVWHFDRVKKDIEEMVFDLKVALKAGITLSNQLDYQSKVASLFKVEAMKTEILDPYDKLNQERVLEYYKDFNATGNFFESLLAFRKIKATEILERVNNYNFSNSWIYSTKLFEPYYDQPINTIIIPSSLMYDPYYQVTEPESLKFGGLGTALVREMSNAIDRYGLEVDEFGKLRNIWPKYDIPYFDKTRQCIRRLYTNFLDLEHSNQAVDMNRPTAFEEELGEVAAVHIAYQAYKYRYERSERKKTDSDFMKMSTQRFFFTSYAYTLCGYHTQEADYRIYNKLWKAPSRTKILSTLMYSDEFYSTFQCKDVHKLDDENCIIWRLKEEKSLRKLAV